MGAVVRAAAFAHFFLRKFDNDNSLCFVKKHYLIFFLSKASFTFEFWMYSMRLKEKYTLIHVHSFYFVHTLLV